MCCLKRFEQVFCDNKCICFYAVLKINVNDYRKLYRAFWLILSEFGGVLMEIGGVLIGCFFDLLFWGCGMVVGLGDCCF